MLSHQKTIDKIDEFGTYKKGWRGGEGIPFANVTIRALELVAEAAKVGFIHTDAFPGTAGEIMITIYDEPHYLEFIIGQSATVDFVREMGKEEVEYSEDVPFDEAKAKIGAFYKEWHG